MLMEDRIFNMGSPYNRHSSNSVNLEGVINHYTQKNRALAEGVKTKTSEQIYAERSS